MYTLRISKTQRLEQYTEPGFVLNDVYFLPVHIEVQVTFVMLNFLQIAEWSK